MPRTRRTEHDDDASLAYFAPLKLRPFLELAREHGVDVDKVLAGAGTSPGEMFHPETRLPRLRCVAIVRALTAPLHDPLVGLHAAERAQLEDIDVLGYLARQCPTALVALEKMQALTRLVGDASEVSLERAPGQVIVRLGLSGGRTSIPELADFGVASGHIALKLLTGGGANALRVELARPKPKDPAAYKQFFGAPVQFGAARGMVVYDEAAFLAPLPRSDARLAEMLREHAHARLERLPARSNLLDLVRARLRAQCEDNGPSLRKVAAALRMSERTLSRRLDQAGTQFRALLDEVRRERAEYLLQASALSISDIAQRLGFSDATAFGRAFRRWFGVTPTRYRALKLS
jgi:AraC-like DNA-binding protein